MCIRRLMTSPSSKNKNNDNINNDNNNLAIQYNTTKLIL